MPWCFWKAPWRTYVKSQADFTSCMPFHGIVLNLSPGPQGWTVSCGLVVGVGKVDSCVFSVSLGGCVILVIIMLVSFGNSLDDG